MSDLRERLYKRAEQVGALRSAIKIANDYLDGSNTAAAHDVIRRTFVEIEADEAAENAALRECK
jgi:hypothetical protein